MGNPSCNHCQRELEPGKFQCFSCGGWNFAPKNQVVETKTLADEDDEEIAKICEDTWWGGLMGGGLPDTCSILLGAEPGCGKTTLALQIALASIRETRKSVVYLAIEQIGKQLKPYARRVGYKPGSLKKVIILEKEEVDLELECLEQFDHEDVCLVILDSAAALAGRNENLTAEICQRINEWSMSSEIPSIIIDHVTKNHDFAGLKALEHFVGMTIYIQDHKGQSRRTWTTLKNRFGVGQVTAEIAMTEHGLVPMKFDDLAGEYVIA